jgi:MFS family permease
MPSATSQPPPAAQEPVPVGFLGRFGVLKGAARELWLVFGIKFLGIAAYSVTNKTLVLWLSSDFGYSDQKAVGLVGAWALSLTVCTLLVGSLTDAIGLRRTFFLGVWICLFARAVMVFSTIKWLVLIGGLLPLALGEALGTPVLLAAVRRYSNVKQRSVSFSLFYTIMNIGFWAAARLFDYVRQGLGEHGHFNLAGMEISSYRTLLLVSLVFELSLLPVLCFLRKGVEATEEGVKIVGELVKYPEANLWSSFRFTVRDSVNDTLRLFRGLLQQTGFYRLLAFLVLIGFLKVIFMQMDYVFPKFGIRELGDGAPIGRLSSINYILIILLVPIIGVLTQKLAAYKMVILGGAISAASVFIMAMPTGWFKPLANGFLGHWIGHLYLGLTGDVHPYYVMIVLYVVLLSVGEAFYSPRVYEYAAAIAPKGQEASYGALSYIPFLLAKLLVGTSGVLLAKYCPEHGPRHPAVMWLIFALTATIAPVGLIALRRFIRLPEAGRQ